MGQSYSLPEKTGPSPFTRSGEPPVKLNQTTDKPQHRVNDVMSLQLHMADERQRMAGLSPAEREWRMKWLKDQHLHPDEPIHVDAIHRQLNPVRMLYRRPWDLFYTKVLVKRLGPYYGLAFRQMVPKLIIGFLTIQFVYYQWKYQAKNWEAYSGLTTFVENPIRDKKKIEEEYPGLYAKAMYNDKQYDYHDRTYQQRLTHRDVGEPNRKY
ncbi:unnamed protein product [Bursaphelenchus okinawaensis]|uniref:Complex I-B17 n=1 Tax=Bursaphelenchus okinawaensis TaxID=465554 RepID=A0A811K8I3_9BILA|nr:unnamed protein product [Bursaphelenchus okinawaensis]CAG9093211.1 unnamed protein product [Bursaphelenchus okinawaensis]